jgi:hypothetical protein
MSTSKITIVGAEKWLNANDSSLFENAVFPSGIDKSLVLDAVIMRGGEFELLYPDIEYMKDASTRWAARWNRTFDRWINALNVEYEPLNNYDRTEEWTTTDDGSDLTTRNLADSQQGSSTDTGTGTSTDTVSAYNSNTFQNDRKNDSTSSGSTTTSTSGTETGTVNVDHENTNIRSGRAYGNIGVTTSQQMLQAELDVALWNLYEHIADIYLNEFAIPIY